MWQEDSKEKMQAVARDPGGILAARERGAFGDVSVGGETFFKEEARGKGRKTRGDIFWIFFLLFEKGRTRVRGTGFTEKYGVSLRKKGARGKKKVSVGVVHGFSREFLEPKQ